jgi:hypothetical protein
MGRAEHAAGRNLARRSVGGMTARLPMMYRWKTMTMPKPDPKGVYLLTVE